MITLKKEDIVLNQSFSNKKNAIEAAGKLLSDQGYVEKEYIKKMIERDQLTTTYIGNMVAIPHGTDDSKQLINQSGIVILQIPEGVDFDGNEVKLIIGIAGLGDAHLELLSQIALVCSEIQSVEQLIAAESEAKIIELFKEEVTA
ncbi:PTS sugar transporter subunit IIA [Enterococcus ureasiticus]|uniref:Mannitol-specific phosphotransferase enzyme IIA component n=1 Tax=Enterococcus ureasiticus TaxID=903984 RepID=A0A1E5GNE2_9ENTE|nr:PTS sugar transporter subunit IIA [Enterococcus ureasiticus]OEG14212.1 PTS mannitol transporter subunit IIA [Enterococcus ureasiticus]